MRTKTLTLYDRQYQLRRMNADVASYIYMRMMGAIMRSAVESAADSTAEEPTADEPKPTDEQRAKLLCTLAMMRGLDFNDIKFVQKNAMLIVDVIDAQAGPIPAMATDGRWADPVLAEDPGLVHMLTIEALAFNLASFFAERNGATTN